MKIVVVGAGLVGLSTAHFLRASGHDVVVLERRDGPALETSFANAGMLTPSQAEPWNEPGILWKLMGWLGREDAPVLLRPSALPALMGWGWQFLRNSTAVRFAASTRANAMLARYSLDSLRVLRSAADLQYGQICHGTLKVYRNGPAMEAGLHVADMLKDLGIVQHRLDARATVQLEPALADIAASIVGGIHFPDDESGDAHRFCIALEKHLRRAGVDLRYGMQVARLIPGPGGVGAVQVGGDEVKADAFVLCAASLARPLARPLGLDLPIRPVKGYSITVPLAPGAPAPALPIVDDTRHAAITPLDGFLRVAGTAEFAGFDTSLRAARIQNLRDVVAEVLPRHLPGPAVDIRPWTGLRPYACDGVPIIGASTAGNLFINAGHGHLGWTLAAGSGRLLAQLMDRKAPDIDPAPYAVGRFTA